MVKQLSSIDVNIIVKELMYLESSRVGKIYSIGKEEIYIQLYKTNVGKNFLRIISGKAMFVTETKSVDEMPSHFCTMLRRHLGNKILDSIKQLHPERIIEFVFRGKDEIKKIYIEIFGKGNVILCNNETVIIDSLTKHKFRERSILPKRKYKYPNMPLNIFDIKKNELAEMFKESKKDKIVISLATELGLGGVYSEEICLLSNIDKNKDPNHIVNKEIAIIRDSIKKLINKKNNPQIIYKDKEAIDVVPFDTEFYKENEKKKFEGFNQALDYYFTNELKLIKRKESVHTKQINELKRIIDEQKETMESQKRREKENREKAELIYNNYKLIQEIIVELNKAKEKHSWEDIKKKLRGHKVVKDVDIKEKKVTIEIN